LCTGWASVVGSQWNAHNTFVQTGNYPPCVMQDAFKLSF
jgi:hypothetical protein